MKRILFVFILNLCSLATLMSSSLDTIRRVDIVAGDTVMWRKSDGKYKGMEHYITIKSEWDKYCKAKNQYFPASMDIYRKRSSFQQSELWFEANDIQTFQFLNLLTGEERDNLLAVAQTMNDHNLIFSLKMGFDYVKNEALVSFIVLSEKVDTALFSSQRLCELVRRLKTKIYIPPLTASYYRPTQGLDFIISDLNIKKEHINKYMLGTLLSAQN